MTAKLMTGAGALFISGLFLGGCAVVLREDLSSIRVQTLCVLAVLLVFAGWLVLLF